MKRAYDTTPIPAAMTHACGHHEVSNRERTRELGVYCAQCELWFAKDCHKCSDCARCREIRRRQLRLPGVRP